MPHPTEFERESAAKRAAIAARQAAEYDQVKRWARDLFGPGWMPSGRHFLLDHDEEQRARETGTRAQAAATVYHVRASWGARHFVVDQAGRPAEVAGHKDGFGPMLLEPHPTRGFADQAGRFHHFHRYALCWAPFDLYEPQTAERLAEAREKRQAKRRAAERAALPLFANQF